MIWLNDSDPFVVEWGRNMIVTGLLPEGHYNSRSIEEVGADELSGYGQHHFFAGIGGWPLALQLAGWPEDAPVWTGSCPCQPFSVAGQRKGSADERHLWPDWFRLIQECHPPVIFGEQVASKDGYAWFDIVQADLESVGYACGMVVSPAAGYGAPHIRHRIYFVANRIGKGLEGGNTGTLGNEQQAIERSGGTGIMADTESEQVGRSRQSREAGATNGWWMDAEWLPCTDGKTRPTQPGLFPLAHGVPSRVGRLRAYGNAIVVPQAVEFIRAYISVAALKAGEEQANDQPGT